MLFRRGEEAFYQALTLSQWKPEGKKYFYRGEKKLLVIPFSQCGW
ncbi:hypothetical protein [Thermospira aquatica]|nr:hypothetical protein [Thermospira aquatica]